MRPAPALRARTKENKHAGSAKVDFHGMEPSPFIERRIEERIAKLRQFHDRMTGCRVVEAPHHRRRHGNLYQVHIGMLVPGAMLSVNRHPGQDPAHADVYIAIRDAFDAAERRLDDYDRKPSAPRAAVAIGGKRG